VWVGAVGRGEFRYPSRIWASFFISLTLSAMVVGTLGALFHRGLPERFWAGYASCGWFYLLLHFGPWFRDEIAPFLLTTACLDLIYPNVAAVEQGAAVADATNQSAYGLAGGFGGGAVVPVPASTIWEHWTGIDGAGDGFTIVNNYSVSRSTSFGLIGHSLFALLFAYLGGLTARRFARLGTAPASSPG
jgi:hypothetical protein